MLFNINIIIINVILKVTITTITYTTQPKSNLMFSTDCFSLKIKFYLQIVTNNVKE